MSGAIMPAPLAKPLMVTVALPMRARAVATFGKVSVVMIARAARVHSRRAPRRRPVWPARRRTLSALSGSPITPVEARKTSSRLQPTAAAASFAVKVQASRPVLPVKALALPELTTSARRPAALHVGAAPFDRRRRTFRAGEHPGDAGARVEHGEHHVGAALIADAGGGGRQAHAGDRGHVGNVFRSERRDGGRHDKPRRRHARARPWHPYGRGALPRAAWVAGSSPATTNFEIVSSKLFPGRGAARSDAPRTGIVARAKGPEPVKVRITRTASRRARPGNDARLLLRRGGRIERGVRRHGLVHALDLGGARAASRPARPGRGAVT